MKILTTSIKMLAGAAAMAAVVLIYTPGLQAASETTATHKAEKTGHERHPHIRAAIRELREALHEMKEADHDFSGHRVAAMQAAETAVEQLRLAVEADKK